MAKFIWDLCHLDSDSVAQIDLIQPTAPVKAKSTSSKNTIGTPVGSDEAGSNSIYDLQESIVSAEKSCRESLAVVDGLLNVLNDVSTDYEDVTGRTNSLMMNCENLLEQQHTYQQTVEVLKLTLAPFNDIEAVAALLGIPFSEAHSSAATSPRADSTSSLSQAYASSSSPAGALDPRSPEFRDILNKLAKAAIYLKTHGDIMDSERYEIWLEKLENRASSLVGRAMREIIENASRSCLELYEAKKYTTPRHAGAARITNGPSGVSGVSGIGGVGGVGGVGGEDGPIESAPLYQKFRGLSYRLRELSALVLRGQFAEALALNDAHKHSGHSHKHKRKKYVPGKVEVEVPVINEVKQGYVVMRNELLLPFIRETWVNSLRNSVGSGVHVVGSGIDLVKILDESKPRVNTGATANNTTSTALVTTTPTAHVSLCTGIRHAFSTLLRITQLELQLYESLFILPPETAGEGSEPGTPATPAGDARSPRALHTAASAALLSGADTSEVNSIVESVANTTRDFLRPFIIKESSVDELCRVVAALSEDVRSQMLAMPVPGALLKLLLNGLDGTVNDAKERLSYCAEMRIRQEVQMFDPLPSHLAYPDILEEHLANIDLSTPRLATPTHATTTSTTTTTTTSTTVPSAVTDVYQTWYPPMRNALSLLSKLYGVVELVVFEDFARRAIDLTVHALKKGSEGVRRSHPGMHGDLFLVRHLLMLREQLTPFELRLTSTEKVLDFTSTTEALQLLLSNTRSILRFDQTNGLLTLARTGLPRMQDVTIDAKKELDLVLKSACMSLKSSAVKSLLGGMEAFLVKVSAFIGDIPISTEGSAADPAAAAKLASSNASASAADGTTTTTAPSGATLAQDNGVPLLPAADRTRLKGQSFVRPERIKEVLEGVQSVLMQRVPDLKAVMKLYIENGVARTILLKPILQDFEVTKRKMECIIASVLDAGQQRRDLEHLLQTITMTVLTDLSR